jgi:hypothetical protein
MGDGELKCKEPSQVIRVLAKRMHHGLSGSEEEANYSGSYINVRRPFRNNAKYHPHR